MGHGSIGKVRRIKQIKYEKERYRRFGKPTKKEKVSYISNSKSSLPEITEINEDNMTKGKEVKLAELKIGSSYTCKLLQKSEVNDKVENQTYTFDVSKAN